MNDCLYSAIDQFDWVTSHDVDEYIYVNNATESLRSMLDRFKQETSMGAILLKSWVHEASEPPWISREHGVTPWGVRKQNWTSISLGANEEMLTLKHHNRKHARPIEGGYFKWYTKTAYTASVIVHNMVLHGHSQAAHVPETIMHFKHYYELYNNRPVDCSGGKHSPGWCPMPGELDNYSDTSMYDRHGAAFSQLWPYRFGAHQQSLSSNWHSGHTIIE